MARTKARVSDDTHAPGYEALGHAIIAQAYKDYIECEFAPFKEIITKDGAIVTKIPKMNDPYVNQDEITTFFHSGFYMSLTDIDGDYILKLAEKEIDLIKRGFREGMNWNMFLLEFGKDYGYLEKATNFSTTKADYDTYYKNVRNRRNVHRAVLKYENKRDILSEPELTYYIVDKHPMPEACQPKGIRNGVVIAMDTKHIYRYNAKKKAFKDLGHM